MMEGEFDWYTDFEVVDTTDGAVIDVFEFEERLTPALIRGIIVEHYGCFEGEGEDRYVLGGMNQSVNYICPETGEDFFLIENHVIPLAELYGELTEQEFVFGDDDWVFDPEVI